MNSRTIEKARIKQPEDEKKGYLSGLLELVQEIRAIRDVIREVSQPDSQFIPAVVVLAEEIKQLREGLQQTLRETRQIVSIDRTRQPDFTMQIQRGNNDRIQSVKVKQD